MQQLRLMRLHNLLRNLQLQNNLLFHHQIRSKSSHQLPPKRNLDRNLRLHTQPTLPQGNRHSPRINRLQKPKPQLVINLIEHPNNLLRKLSLRTRKSISFRVSFIDCLSLYL